VQLSTTARRSFRVVSVSMMAWARHVSLAAKMWGVRHSRMAASVWLSCFSASLGMVIPIDRRRRVSWPIEAVMPTKGLRLRLRISPSFSAAELSPMPKAWRNLVWTDASVGMFSVGMRWDSTIGRISCGGPGRQKRSALVSLPLIWMPGAVPWLLGRPIAFDGRRAWTLLVSGMGILRARPPQRT